MKGKLNDIEYYFKAGFCPAQKEPEKVRYDIEQYGGVLKVYVYNQLNPSGSRVFFYVSANADILLYMGDWVLRNGYVYGRREGRAWWLHQEVYKLFNERDYECIDHINHIVYDDVYVNLNGVTHRQNGLNRFVRGYKVTESSRTEMLFTALITLNNNKNRMRRSFYSEEEVLRYRDWLEKGWARNILGDEYYRFNFLRYRVGSEDILDLERTGSISPEEATYRHVMRYADNAWYYLRFGLQKYFEENHIPEPRWNTDDKGYLVHPITNKRLCPI